MIKQINISETPSEKTTEFPLLYSRQNGTTPPPLLEEPIEVALTETETDFDALKQIWCELASESDTFIFQTYEWNRIWWDHFGQGKKLHIVTIYHEKEPIGIAPLFEDDTVLFGKKVFSILRFLGSFVDQPKGEPLEGNISYSDYLDCIIKPGCEPVFYPLLLQHLNEIKSNYDEIKLEEIPESSLLLSNILPLLAKSDSELRYRLEQGSSSPVIKLNKTWESYLKSLSVKDRYNARRYYKRSKADKNKSFHVEKLTHIENLQDVLNSLYKMHQIQWNNRGFAGTFSETRMRNFLTDISEAFFKKGWIEFNMALPVDSEMKIVAMDVILIYKNRVYLMHRGMDENPIFRKLGPGNVLLYANIQESISRGVEVFDMLRGSEEFKLRIATSIAQNKVLRIYTDRKTTNLLPWLAKTYLKISRFLRNEGIHFKILLSDESLLNGLVTYSRFMKNRVWQKLHL